MEKWIDNQKKFIKDHKIKDKIKEIKQKLLNYIYFHKFLVDGENIHMISSEKIKEKIEELI